MRQLGIGYRRELAEWLESEPPEVKSLEITAEHFFGGGDQILQRLAERYPLAVHGLGLSLGTPGPLCQPTLEKFARVAELANAQWVSEHIAFSRTADVDLGHLNPVPRTEDSLQVLVDHAIELSEYCSRPVVLENITSSLDVGGTIRETEFLNRLCEKSGCGILLDVTNLFINSKNHQFDAHAWYREIDPASIRQLHVVGYSLCNGTYQDHHSARIQDDLMELIVAIVKYAGVEFVTLERDERLNEINEIESELSRLATAST